MTDIAIRVEHLGKRYKIGRAQRRHDTLRESLMHGLRAPLQRFHRAHRASGAGLKRVEGCLGKMGDVVKEGRTVCLSLYSTQPEKVCVI